MIDDEWNNLSINIIQDYQNILILFKLVYYVILLFIHFTYFLLIIHWLVILHYFEIQFLFNIFYYLFNILSHITKQIKCNL